MKNQTILFFAILAIAFTSCKKETVTFTEFNKKADTTIMFVHYKPILQNRIGCNDSIIPTKFVDGKPVGQKIKGWEMISESIPVNVSVNVTADDMKNHMTVGQKPAVDNSSSNSSFWNGFGFCGLIPWLLLAALIVLVAWLLSRLRWFRDRNVTHTHVHTYPQPPVPPVAKPEQEKSNLLSAIDYLKFSSEKDADGKEKTKLKFESGIPMDVLLSGMKQSGSGNNHTIINVFGDGNNTITVTNTDEKPVKP